MESSQRKGCPSLQLLCQIQVIRLLHKKAAALEAQYIDQWSTRELTGANQTYERNLDIRTNDVDTSTVVSNYQAKRCSIPAEDTNKKKRAKRGSVNSAKEPSKKRNTKVNKNSLLKSFTNGIPNGIPAKEYILYRKCKYVEDIRSVRKLLMESLNASTMNGLMSTLYNISLYNTKQEHGLLTLQAMLSTELVTDFRLASAKLYINFSREPGMETSIGTTILHYTILEGSRLVHLNLERCGCDSLLELLSKVAKNLKYLQISGSHVSDRGLLLLCGAEKRPMCTRPKLTRACKEIRQEGDQHLGNDVPKYLSVEGAGCLNLEHLEANNLLSIDWHQGARNLSFRTYKESPTVPFDSGFVAVLLLLPKLRVFVTEIGGRTVHSYLRMHRKLRKPSPPLALESISETHLTPSLMSSILTVCPNMRELRVNWSDFISTPLIHREDWVDQLSLCQKLTTLRSKEIDFSTDKFATSLNKIGNNITIIDFRELCVFRYSNFRAMKLCCPNLRDLTLAMTTKSIFTSSSRIEVDKDANLELFPDPTFKLTKLERLHMSGPFGNAVTKYLLRGADAVSSISLGIEWFDAAFCSTQPDNRSDYMGKEYMEELLKVNELSNLQELHLYAQFRRGRHRLTKDCAEFVMNKFTKLKHLGNFGFWNLNRAEKNELLTKTRSSNRGILFDEDLFTTAPPNSHQPSKFEYRYIEGRQKFACNHINFKKDQTGFLADFFEVLAGPPELFADVDSDDSDSDDDDVWSDEDMENDNLIVNADVEPVCVIM